jgi:hypothetical protein
LRRSLLRAAKEGPSSRRIHQLAYITLPRA